MTELDNINISTHLGKNSAYIKQYTPSLLVREPRQSNRKHLGISDEVPPFVGSDVWNGYEVSCLLNNGTPVNATARVSYDSNNKFIVESKSMKLYWNSFNMTKLGDSAAYAFHEIEDRASRDLSDLLETKVQVGVLGSMYDHPVQPNYWGIDYLNIDVNCQNGAYCDTYNETPALLVANGYEFAADANTPQLFWSSALKSNCRVTSQPDFGDVYIHYKGKYKISQRNLLKYIVSFRDECHFHEEICETIYKRLYDLFEPQELMVACLYTRRGGWDINPIRSTHLCLIPELFTDVNKLVVKTQRQ
jgi:7-cyano-7-deazaguanine reductase